MRSNVYSVPVPVKLSYKIDQNDFDVRVRAVQKFIADGDRVNETYFQIVFC